MESAILRIRSQESGNEDPFRDLARELRSIEGANVQDTASAAARFSEVELIVALGSAGAFTAAYNVIARYLERNKNSKVTVRKAGQEVTITGYSRSEASELLAQLYPAGDSGDDGSISPSLPPGPS